MLPGVTDLCIDRLLLMMVIYRAARHNGPVAGVVEPWRAWPCGRVRAAIGEASLQHEWFSGVG